MNKPTRNTLLSALLCLCISHSAMAEHLTGTPQWNGWNQAQTLCNKLEKDSSLSPRDARNRMAEIYEQQAQAFQELCQSSDKELATEAIFHVRRCQRLAKKYRKAAVDPNWQHSNF